MAAPPGWTRRPRQFTLPSVAGQIDGRPAMFRFRRGKVTTSALRSTRSLAGPKPWAASVAGPIILHPQCSRRGAWTILGVVCESDQGILQNVVQGNEWFDLSVSGGSVSDGDFARHWCEIVIGSASRLALWSRNRSLMHVHGPGRQQADRLAVLEGRGRDMSTSTPSESCEAPVTSRRT